MSERTQAFFATATFTPAAAAYGAGDIMEGKKELAGIGPILGGGVMITSASLEVDETALQASEAAYRLHFYSVTPPSNLADNAAFDIPSGDRASYRGYIDLGTPVDIGATLYVETNGINKQIGVAGSANGGSLYAYLQTIAGFTATATARIVKIHAIGL